MIKKVLVLILSIFISVAAFCEPTPVKPCSELIFGGIKVLCFSEGIGAFSSFERVKAIETRLETFSEDRTFDLKDFHVEEHETTTDILAKDSILISIREIDIDPAVNLNRQEYASNTLKLLRKAVKTDRTQKTPTELLWSAGKTIALSIALYLILLLMGRIFPRFYSFITANEGRYINSVTLKSYEILNSKRIVSFIIGIAKSVRLVTTVFLFYVYIPLVLSFFPWTAEWAPKILKYVLDPMKSFFSVTVGFIPNLFFIVVIAVVTRYVLKLIKFCFEEIEEGRLEISGFYQEWASPTYKLVRVLSIAFALVMAFPYIPGSSSPAFQGVSVFLGILISLGSSSAIANMVSGVVITYMRPFKLGDRVKIADTMGDVVEKNLLVTRIRSIKNVDITIPNSMVLSSHIINYSSTAQREGLILNTTVTIGYDAPWKEVHEILIRAAERTELITKDRKPFILQTALNDFYVAYELNAYTFSPHKMAQIYSDLHQNIQDSFNEAGVEIMSPHYSALRDGNEVTTPKHSRAANYEVPKFRVET